MLWRRLLCTLILPCASVPPVSGGAAPESIFRRHHNRFNLEWPLRPDEPFEFMKLAQVIRRLFPHRSEDGLWAVSVGGPDEATPELKSMPGVAFDIREKMLNQFVRAKQELGAITPASFAAKVREAIPSQLPFAVLKIDIDGFDCSLLEALTADGHRPKIIIIEAQPSWPPPFVWRLEYSTRWAWGAGGDFFYGCSLQAVARILRPLGYSLLQYTMEDAWFVRLHGAASLNSTFPGLPRAGLTPREAYRRGNPHFYSPHAMRHKPGGTNMSALLHGISQQVELDGGGSPALLAKLFALFRKHNGAPAPVPGVPYELGFESI